MSEQTAPKLPPIEDRLAALEQQAFIMYLQLNSITKILVEDKEILSREELMETMEDLHKKVNEVTEEYVKEQSKTAETPAEEPTADNTELA